jgi:hypothetical protein
MQQANRIAIRIIRTKTVRTDQLGKPIALMRRRHIAASAHFGKTHTHTALGQLPRRFASGKAAADNVDLVRHVEPSNFQKP